MPIESAIDAYTTDAAFVSFDEADKGRLAPGFDADIVLFDPEARYAWRPLGASDVPGSLWADRPVVGRVTDVWLRGRRVVKDGALCAEQPGGEFLARTLDPQLMTKDT